MFTEKRYENELINQYNNFIVFFCQSNVTPEHIFGRSKFQKHIKVTASRQ